MKGINPSMIDVSKLGFFGNIATKEGDRGRATLQLTKTGIHKVGDTYNSFNIPGRWFRGKANKEANNAIRTQLLENLGATFGIAGATRDKSGDVIFSKDFMDQLERLLGKDVFARSNFSVGKDGKVRSGSPLTERRITAIVERTRQLAGVTAATAKMNNVLASLNTMLTESHLGLKVKRPLTPLETAMFIKGFKDAGGTMDLIDTGEKLSGMLKSTTGHECRVVTTDKEADDSILKATLNNIVSYKAIFESDEVKKAADLLIKTGDIKRTNMSSVVNHLPPSATELREVFDFTAADVFVGKDNVAGIRKNPTGHGTVVAHYPDDVKDVREMLEKKYKAASDEKTVMSGMKLFLPRGFVFEIDGEEFTNKNTTPEALERKLKDFFNDNKLANAMDKLFQEFLTLQRFKEEDATKGGLSVASGVDTGMSSFQKLSIQRNADGSIQTSIQIYSKNPKTIMVFAPAVPKTNMKANPTVTYATYSRPENDPEDSFFSQQMVFNVRKDGDDLSVEGVGENPSSIKFKYSDKYKVDEMYKDMAFVEG